MAVNLDRFKKDLDRLIEEGALLQFAMIRAISQESFDEQYGNVLGKEGFKTFIEKLPNFNTEYEGWYSESLVLLRQLLPDRVHNFTALYEKPKGRKSIEDGNYVIRDYLQALRVTHYGETKVDTTAAILSVQTTIIYLNGSETALRKLAVRNQATRAGGTVRH